MKRLLILFLILCPLSAKAAAPYDAVGRLSPPGKTHGGSCILIYSEGGRGLVVTNAHVCGDSDTFEVMWGHEKRSAKTVAFFAEEDICFLVVKDPPVEPAPLGMRDDHVVFTGYPHYDRCHLHWQHGYVIEEAGKWFVWKNMPVPGMSGGGVFDKKDGDLCGLVRAGDDGIGWGVVDVSLLARAYRFEDPKTWIPSSAHVKQKKPNWKSAKQNPKVITNVYDPKTAPKLGD